MPTNRLWLEHTERAAWDSVQALRQKLAAAEERLQRFTPVKETWQSIVEALDRARSELDIKKERYSDIAHALVEELHSARSVRDKLTADLELARNVSPPPATALRSVTALSPVLEDVVSDVSESDDTSMALRTILAQYEADAVAHTGKQRLAMLRKALERRLEELEELDEGAPSEIAEQAARIGALAVRLIAFSRAEKERRQAARHDDDE